MDIKTIELFEDSFRLLDSLKEKGKEAEESIHLAMRGELRSEYLRVRSLNSENLRTIRQELLQLHESLQGLEM